MLPNLKKRVYAHPHWFIALVFTLASAIYWNFVATARYVSIAYVVLDSPQPAQSGFSIESILSGSRGLGELLLLREHLMSVDMLRKLESSTNLREHYSLSSVDRLTRLADSQAPIEKLHRYMQRRIEINVDEYSQLLRVRVEAFDALTAQQIAEILLAEGEAHMNTMGHRLAEEQVKFLERQVELQRKQYDLALEELLTFQNETGLISPEITVQSISQVVSALEGQLAYEQARRRALLSFNSPNSSQIRQLDAEIQALREQITQEKNRLAQASGNALNALSSTYQMLEMQLRFATNSYSAVLEALESTRIEAARQLKQVSILQTPHLAEFAIEPRRIYQTTLYALIAFFTALMTHMLILIIKDHKD